jgi:transposase
MSRFIEGEDRSQSVLFPERLDEWITEDNPVRVIDAFVEELDLAELGFGRAEPADTGRPAYHPAMLLKIYIYGYLNRIQSSRRLEREAQRNVELIWLTGRLMPDFKTIADFRKDNGAAIRKVCQQFVEVSRRVGLFSEATVAVDGSKFKAVNARDKNFTKHKIDVRRKHLQESIEHYLVDLDRADRLPGTVPEARVSHVKEKIAAIKGHLRQLVEIEKQLPNTSDQQVSLTDPDARSMNSRGKGTGVVGYNVQTAVDTEHHMIVAHEVINETHDRKQLVPMANLARDAMGQKKITVLADRGYFSSEQFLQCDRNGITPLVPKALTSNSRADGRFDRRDFVYDAKRDEYRCPAGERAIWRMTSIERGLTLHRYWPSACPRCPIRTQCTTSAFRKIARWEHEELLEAMQRRLEQNPEVSRVRRRTAEHPFGTLKAWMGSTHFLTKTLPRVRTEMSLHVLAYNIKRAIQILGVQPLLQFMKA